MITRINSRKLLAVLVSSLVLTGCDGARQEPPPQRGGLQIEVERDPKEDGGGVKVKINKPADEKPKNDNGAKEEDKDVNGDEDSFGGTLWAMNS